MGRALARVGPPNIADCPGLALALGAKSHTLIALAMTVADSSWGQSSCEPPFGSAVNRRD